MGKVGMVLRRDRGHSATAQAAGGAARRDGFLVFSGLKSALLFERIVHCLR
jgi:hypothetical protein